jgi:amidase
VVKRRDFLKQGILTVATASTAAANRSVDTGPRSVGDVNLEEATLDDLQGAMATGRLTSEQLTLAYSQRIENLNVRGPALRAVIDVNPEAQTLARGLDAERRAKGARGPLHGIPVLVKDNIDTGDTMGTTAGSLALERVPTVGDATLVRALRAAGAVVLGKTNLSEWANFRSTRATSGWSARGGLTANPYSLDRTCSGSSSGSAVAAAANLCAVAVGTETDGSVTMPASNQFLVGLKPTVGLVSRTGIIPISTSQDTAGPMGRTVKDVALLLGAMVCADAEDAATQVAQRRAASNYAEALRPTALKGARLGVVRELAGHQAPTLRLFEAALEDLKRGGAELFDVTLPTGSLLEEPEMQVLLFEFKQGLASYLSHRRPSSKIQSLADLIAFNQAHAAQELSWFGQELFEHAQATGGLSSTKYLKALKTCRALSRTQGIDAALASRRLDALVTITSGPPFTVDLLYGDRPAPSGTSPAAVAGYPSVTVPMGDVQGLPTGLLLFGAPWTEAKLLGLAYAYEQATHHRKPPTFAASLGLDRG